MFKNLKAALALVLALVFVFSAVSCGKGGDKDDGKDGSRDNTASAEQSGAEVSKAEVSKAEASEAEVSEAVASGDEPSQDESKEPAPDATRRDPDYKALNYDPMKAIWISQWDTTIFSANERQRDKTNYKGRVEKICKGVAKSGFNTIIVQLRPNGDSYFPSEYYCPSPFVVGMYGREFTYDPIKIFVETAHKHNLSFHAWLNPMRLMTKAEIEKVDEKYTVAKWYRDETLRDKYLSLYKDRYYLVPGFAETRKLVADGVAEVCRNYNVDAVHIDDYFYPTMEPYFDAADKQTIDEEFGGYLPAYRLAKVDELVFGLYKACKSVSPDILFGISPQGSVQNNMHELYANVVRWTSEPGFCDYIAPQVYWGFEHPDDARKFDVCCQKWIDMCTEPSVRLIIGIGLYRAKGAREDDKEFSEYFRNKDVTKRQLEYLEGIERVGGFGIYSYVNLFDSYGRLTRQLEEERENFFPVLKAFRDKEA